MPSLHYHSHVLTWTIHGDPGRATFVLINGYSGSQQAWAAEIEYLSTFGQCVTLDLPGHFPAVVPPAYTALSSEDLLAMESAALREIASGQPIFVMGHSTGGFVALAFAARHPELVRGVVAFNPVIWGRLAGLLRLAQWLLRHRLYPFFWFLWRITQFSPAMMMFGLTFYVHQRLNHWRNPLAWRLCQQSHPGYRQQPLRNLAILLLCLWDCDLRPEAHLIHCPVLLINGAHDPIIPAEQGAWLASQVPTVEQHIFPEVGHIAQLEDHAHTRDVVLGWLQKYLP